MRLFAHWNKWVTVTGIALAIMMMIFLGFILSIYSARSDNEQVTIGMELTTIPVSTFTPTNFEINLQATPSATSPLIDGIRIGMYVQIIGTGGSGLRIRSAPGLDSSVNFYGLDNEVFLVKDGPYEKDNYTWWQLVASYDESRNGWAASDFLEVIVQQP